MKDEVYLRFRTGALSILVGEARLSGKESRLIKLSSASGQTLPFCERDVITLPYWHDARIKEGQNILDIFKDDTFNLSFLPLIDGIKLQELRNRRLRKPINAITLMNPFETLKVKIPSKEETKSVFIPYNGFTIERKSILEDPLISDFEKNYVKEYNLFF